ncbi:MULTISPECIES: cysteine rich repeat-containing protein [unclassified Tardiphaga]|uniref:cysteine rich repeat-containing protein n=1 Tax=unclassified Tardiphaga TaxID=2631404 RepID=UPI001FCD44E4|nr:MULTISPECIES: cysteine rich repeat-containing protein [unclassified Tardiphaga]
MATIILIAIASPTFAQAPSQAQRDAIKTQCRSDYIAHCSSVPPGGEASLQCLQKNMASLSAGCAGAVRAVQAPTAAPKATAPTPAAAPKTEATPPATKPAPATAAPKAAVKSTAPPPAAAATTATPAAAAAPAAIVLRPMRPREELLVMRSACGGDIRSLCGGIAPGGGRIVQCLASNSASLSPACTSVLAPFAQR